jgi:hypothetical protein
VGWLSVLYRHGTIHAEDGFCDGYFASRQLLIKVGAERREKEETA